MRTLIERMRDWRWWGEEVAHWLIGAAIVFFCGTVLWWVFC